MSHLDPLCSSLGFRIGDLQDPLPQQSHPRASYVLLGGDVQGSWGLQARRVRALPGGLCPLASLGRGCSPAPGKDSPACPPQSPAPRGGSARGHVGLCLPLIVFPGKGLDLPVYLWKVC